ncbi:MAG: diacylglycerol kinase family lipid kinase [Erysipelothrix sp.]|nr:diacylglycerol kinase family lipid kinase [Erysipelothrix sp.]
MKNVFIINPVAGIRKYERYIPWIKEYFKNSDDYEIHITKYQGHATEIASQYTKEDNACVYSIGGDGTAYEVLNGINDGVTMAVVPNGTGDDFHRTVYKKKFDYKEMLINTIEGQVKMIDYGQANDHRFLNMFCIGFDAMIGEAAIAHTNRKFFPNSLSYVVAVIQKVVSLPKFELTLNYNGKSASKETLFLAVLNGQYYGGGFNPTPEADITDGIFEVLWVDTIMRRQIPKLILKYAKGKHKEISQIESFRLDSFNVTTKGSMTYTCDGEIFTSDNINIIMHKNKLPFKIPKGSVLYDSVTE